jgi:hypothetical protein
MQTTTLPPGSMKITRCADVTLDDEVAGPEGGMLMASVGGAAAVAPRG